MTRRNGMTFVLMMILSLMAFISPTFASTNVNWENAANLSNEQNVTLPSSNSERWYKVEMNADESIHLRTADVPAGLAYYVEIYDGNSFQLGKSERLDSESSGKGRTMNRSFKVGEAGIYYIRLRTYSNTWSETPFRLFFTVLQPDQYENNDSWETAKPLQDVQQLKLNSINDEDWFKVEMNADESIHLRTADIPSGLAYYIQIYDGKSFQLGQSVRLDSESSGGGRTINRSVKVSEAGTYYVRLHTYSNTWSETPFRLFFTTLQPDQHENNDSWENAKPLQDIQQLKLNAINDEEWYKVEMNADESIHLRTADIPSGLAYYIQIYDGKPFQLGQSVRLDSESSGGGRTINRSFKVSEAGTYYVRLHTYSNTWSDTPFRLFFTTLQPDDHENNDSWEVAKPLQGEQYLKLNAVNDEEWFKVNMNKGETIHLRTADIPSGLAYYMQIYDGASYDLGQSKRLDSESSGGGRTVNRSYEVPETGSYYIRLHTYSNTWNDTPFRLFFTPLGRDNWVPGPTPEPPSNNPIPDPVDPIDPVEPTPEPPVDEAPYLLMKADEEEVTLYTGESKSVKVSGVDENLTTKDVTNVATWVSKNNEIATVSNGQITGMAAGQTVVTARLGDLEVEITVVVKEEEQTEPPTPEDPQSEFELIINESDFQVKPGDSPLRFNIFTQDKDGNLEDVTEVATYVSSSSRNVLVTPGMITVPSTAKLGKYNVTVSYEGQRLVFEVDITTIQLSKLIAAPAVVTLDVGNRFELDVRGRYTDNSLENVTTKATWFSDDTSVARVVSGEVQAISAGYAKITANLDGKEAVVHVYVNPKRQIEFLEISERNAKLVMGDKLQPIVYANYTNGAKERLASDIVWQSLNSSIASVNSMGVVTGEKPGTTTIIATSGTESETFSVEVVAEKVVTKLEADRYNIQMALDSKWPVRIMATYEDGTKADVTDSAVWSEAIATIANVTNDGLIQANGIGKTTITAEYRGKTAILDVEVLTAFKKERPANALPWKQKVGTAKQAWTVKFTAGLDVNTVHNGTVYITDENDNVIPVYLNLSEDGKELVVTPVGYFSPEITYRLTITTEVKSVTGQTLSKPVVMEFTVN